MPYEIKNNCIYRKDTGEKVGCTKGDVHKYMAALLANTHESVQEESLRKYIRNVLSENVINEDFDSVKEIKEFANQILIYAAKTNVDYVKKQLKEGLNVLFYPVSILDVYQQEPKNFTSIADFITNSNVWVRFRPSKKQKVRGNYSVYDEPYNRERVRTINLFYDDSALTIELSEKNKEREMEYNDLYFSFWYKFASTLEHELQHAFDDFRSNSKLFSTKKAKKFIASDYADDTETDYKKNALRHKQYLNLQHEIWARFTQAVSKTRFTGIDFKGDYIVYHMKPLDDVLKSFRYEFEGWQLLSDNMKKKLMAKVSQFWHKEQDLIPEKNKKELERVANKKESNAELTEVTNFTDEAEPFGYGYDTSAFPPKVFQDKSGEKYMIYIHDWGVGNKEYYVIVATTLGEPIPGKDRYGKQGRHIRGERVGALWLQECEDGIYRSTPTISDGLWVREDKRRQGIATAMHDYANQILGLKTDISTVASQDAKGFWKNRKSSLAEDEIKVPEIPNTMTFWHGGNLDDYDDVIAQKNGRYEYGAGLYLTTSFDVVSKYTKGSRKLYLITVENGVEISDAIIPEESLKAFIKSYVKSDMRNIVWERMQKYRVENGFKANVFNNIVLNSKAIKPTNTKQLRQFYVDNGIDYEIVDNAFGWGEKMLVLYNMKKIVNTIQIKPGDKFDYQMLNPKKDINEVVAGEDEENTEMISGIIDLLCQVKDMNNRKQMVIDQINGLRGEGIDINPVEFARRCGFSESILKEEDYKGEHTAPDKDSGAPLHDLTSMFPQDVYGSDGLRLYGDGTQSASESMNVIRAVRNKPRAIVTVYRAVPDINKDVKKKVKELYDIIAYHDKFGFFPTKNHIIYALEEKYPIEKYGYDKQQELVMDDLYKQAKELSQNLLPAIKINKGDWVALSKQYAIDHGKGNLNNSYKILTKRVLASQLFTDGDITEWGYDF